MYFLLFGIQMSHTVNDFMSQSAASTLMKNHRTTVQRGAAFLH